jgi:hypothetical protein
MPYTARQGLEDGFTPHQGLFFTLRGKDFSGQRKLYCASSQTL